MKLPLTYGSLLALIGALLTFGLFLAGLHDSPDKLHVAQPVSIVVMLAASITIFALAMRSRRAQYPSDREWSYGAAFGTGALTAVCAAVLGAIVSYIYFALVNPQFSDVLYQMQVTKLEEKGLGAAQIEQAEKVMRMFMSPIVLTISSLIQAIIGGVILSLIIAIFFRKPLATVPPPFEPAATPPLPPSDV